MDSAEIISLFFLFLVYSLLLIRTFRRLLIGEFSVSIPVVLVLFVFFVVPLLMDLYAGKADYRRYAGLGYEQSYPEVSVIYNVYLSFVGLLFLRYLKRWGGVIEEEKQKLVIQKIFKIKYLLWAMMFLPLIGVLLSPNPLAYLTYKIILLTEDTDFKESNILVSRLCQLAILASSVLFYFLKRGRFTGIILRYVFYFILTFIIIWVFGKRSIVAEYVVCTLTLGWLLGIFKGYKLVRNSLIFFGLLVIFIISYGKGIYENDKEQTYTATRINFGRDQTVKFVLYREYVAEKPILEYRGQSFLFDICFYIPRSFWPDKPYPYAVYFTNAVFNYPPIPMGWGFTTSILDESIANLGIFGFLFAPMFLLWLCKQGDKAESILLKGFAVLIASLFLVLHLPAFLPIFILFLLSLRISKKMILRNQLRLNKGK